MSKILINNTFYLSFSNLISKLVYFGIIFLIIESIGADKYGKYAIALNYISICSLITLLGFDIVLVKEAAKKKNMIQYLQNKFFPIRFFWSIFVLIFSLISVNFMDYSDDIKKYIYIMSPIILFGGNIASGLSEHFSVVVRAIEKMKYIAIQNIIKILFISFLSLILLINEKMTILNFCIILALTSLLNLFISYFFSQKFINNFFNFTIDFNLLSEYSRPIFVFGSVSLLYGFGGLADIFIISSYLDAEVIGYYSLSLTFIAILTNFISSFQLSVYPFISKMKGVSTEKLSISYILVLIIVILFNFLIMPVISKISLIILGDYYKPTFDLINIFIWVLPLKVVNSWISVKLDLMNKYFIKLVLALIYLSSLLFLLKYAIQLYNVEGVIYTIILSNVITIIFFLILSKFISTENE